MKNIYSNVGTFLYSRHFLKWHFFNLNLNHSFFIPFFVLVARWLVTKSIPGPELAKIKTSPPRLRFCAVKFPPPSQKPRLRSFLPGNRRPSKNP